MKFKVGDEVLVTAGKDKGTKSSIVRVLPEVEKIVVGGVNMYTRHIKPAGGREGQKVRLERAMATAKIAILNDKGQPDRIGQQVAKDGQKVRIFKKTGAVVPDKTEHSKKK
jgi:large subunit ribosomal protein L24